MEEHLKPWFLEEFEKQFGKYTSKKFHKKELVLFISSVAQKEREAGRLEGINSVVLERKIKPCKCPYGICPIHSTVITEANIQGWNGAVEALEKIKSKLKE